jgi:hypothetical protein
MKKLIFTLTIFLITATIASSQAYEGKAEYDKKKQVAFVIQYHYSPEAVENAIRQKMENLGYRAKEEKGIFNKDRGALVFKNAYIRAITKDKMDYIVQIERKSRKQDDESSLYLIILNQDGANAVSTFDAADMQAAKDFLNDLQPEVEAANLEIQIKDQEETVAKAEKKLKTLQDDKAELEQKLVDNGKNQEDTKKDIENQKQLLENLKLKRRGN